MDWAGLETLLLILCAQELHRALAPWGSCCHSLPTCGWLCLLRSSFSKAITDLEKGFSPPFLGQKLCQRIEATKSCGVLRKRRMLVEALGTLGAVPTAQQALHGTWVPMPVCLAAKQQGQLHLATNFTHFNPNLQMNPIFIPTCPGRRALCGKRGSG